MELSTIFKIKKFYQDNGKYEIFVFFNLFCIGYYRKRKIKFFPWSKIFIAYMKDKNFSKKLDKLKESFHDAISLEYIDKFIENSKFWNSYIKSDRCNDEKYWTNYDKQLFEEFAKLEFVQPYPDLLKINSFMYHSLYGLKDLPSEVLKQIDGKAIIDVGGYNGDTLYVFHEKFYNSPVYIYEPIEDNVRVINAVAEKLNSSRVIIKNLALGEEKRTGLFDYGVKVANECLIIPLDEEHIDNIGLIKLDTEGFETKIVRGAKEVIQRDKPVLAVAIYHTPQDFFELKDLILSFNPEYKFMIRRSEPILPSADLVLIAY